MAQSRTATECVGIAKSPNGVGAVPGCFAGPVDLSLRNGSGQDMVTVVDYGWGLPGLGPDGTLALGAMAIAAATATTIAWRTLMPTKAQRR